MIGLTPGDWIALLLFICIAGFALLNGTRYTFARTQTFPPAWVFSVAWTILYPAISIAGFLFWQSGETDAASDYIYQSGFSLWVVQLALNFIWIVVYAEFRSVRAGMAVIVLLLLSSLACTALFIVRATQIPDNGGCIGASVLMGLYDVWLICATAFNALEISGGNGKQQPQTSEQENTMGFNGYKGMRKGWSRKQG